MITAPIIPIDTEPKVGGVDIAQDNPEGKIHLSFWFNNHNEPF